MGQFKNKPLKDIPAFYLVRLYHQKEFMTQYLEINEYIEATHRDLLPLKASKHLLPKYEPLPCEKYTYVDEGEARKALKLIKQDKRTHKKPVRAYQCEVCGYWHLTSKQLIENQ